MGGTNLGQVIDRHVFELAQARREKLDAASAILQPGWRLCVHEDRLGGDLHAVINDAYTMCLWLEYHYLAADQHCDATVDRTEYGLP
jgi:hypothetical protein